MLLALTHIDKKELHIDEMFEAFKQLTGISVTLEQEDREIEFLECTLRHPLGGCLLSVRNLLSQESQESTPYQTRKMLHAMAPNTPSA